jgi:predicted  nucleic acid-binding Zn-ribbon protein
MAKTKGTFVVPRNFDHEGKRFATKVNESIAQLKGELGDPLDGAVTFRDLIDAGIAKRDIRIGSNGQIVGINSKDVTFGDEEVLGIPPAPTGVSADGAFQNIIIEWDVPTFFGFSHAEVWAATTDAFADRVFIGQTTAAVFTHQVGNGQTRYYWIRFVNTQDTVGPFNSTTGTQASTVEDIGAMMQQLSEDLSNLPGYQTLIADEFSDIASDISTLESSVSSLQTTVSGLSTATTRVIKSTSAPTQRDDATSLQGTDIWIDTDDNNQVYVRNAANTAWVKSRDSSLVTLVGTSSFTGSDLTSAMASAQADIITATNTNTSQATAITNLQSDLSSAESDISTNATAISSLGTRVTTNEGDITSITSDVTELESTLTGYSSSSTVASAISGLQTQITANDGDITTITSDVTELESTLTGYSSSSTVASAISGLQTQITANDGDITTINSDVTALEATLTGYSSSSTVASAISGLQTQITANDGDITTINSDITALEATLTGYSSSSTVASAISGLQTQITANDGDISSLSSSVTSLQSQITSNDNDISSQASAISSLQTTVTSQGNSISSNASAITSLQSTTGTNSASITSLQTATTNLQNDANAAYVLKVEANGSVSGMVLEANASGAGAGSAVQFVSDKFAIWNGTSGTAPFIVSSGVVYIDDARIQNGAITNAKLGSAAVDNAKIADAAITNAKIANATIQSAKIFDLSVAKLYGTFAQFESVITGSLTADRISIDGLTLDTNASGELIISSGGVQTGNLSANAATVFDVSSGSFIATGQSATNQVLVTGSVVPAPPSGEPQKFAIIGNTMNSGNNTSSPSNVISLIIQVRSASTEAGVASASYSVAQTFTTRGEAGEAFQTVTANYTTTAGNYYQFRFLVTYNNLDAMSGATRGFGPSTLQTIAAYR